MENNIQDQLNRVANQVEGNEAVEESSETNTEEVVVDEPSNDESVSTPESSLPEDASKQAGAFAAMRKRLKELEDENKTLKSSSTLSPTEEPPKKEEPPKAESKNTEYDTLLKRLEEVESYNKKLQETQIQTRITNEIVEMQQKYALSNDELTEFADQLEQRGYRLNNLNMPLKDMYAAVNADKLIAKEVERVKKELAGQTNYDSAPAPGPKQTNGAPTKEKDNLTSTIRRVASKLQ